MGVIHEEPPAGTPQWMVKYNNGAVLDTRAPLLPQSKLEMSHGGVSAQLSTVHKNDR